MGFLDKINAAKNPAAAAEKKVNPLMKKAAPAVEAAPAVTPAPAPAPAAEAAPAAPKANPFAKKATPAPAATTEAPAAPKKALTLPFKKKTEEAAPAPTPVVEDTPAPVVEAAPAQVAETPAEVKTEVEVVAAPAAEETPAPAQVEEKKAAPKRSSSRSTAKKPEAKEDGPATDVDVAMDETTPMPTTSMSFATAAAAITSPFVDEEWEAFKVEIETELDAIIIDQDMNPGTLKVTLSELNLIYDKIAQPLHQTKSLLENLTNKEDGTIVVIKSVNTGTGNNDMERKKAGFMAAASYTPKAGGTINLFEMAAEVRSRYNFVKNIYDRLKYKSDMLITMNGALKLEKDFIQRGDIA